MSADETATPRARRPRPEGDFEGLLRRLRRGWRRRESLTALAASTAGIVLTAIVASLIMRYAHFDAGAVNAARLGTYTVAVLVLLGVVLPRWLRAHSDVEVALHAERDADLDALLVSAVAARAAQAQSNTQISTELGTRVMHAAAGQSGALGGTDRRGARRAGAALAAAALLACGLGLWGPAWLRHGLTLQLAPLADPAPGNPFSIAVQPGDVVVGFGEDQLIVAQPHAFTPAAATLWVREAGEQAWRTLPMNAGTEGFSVFLRNLATATEYYVAAEGVRSPGYRVDVTRLPRLRGLELVYHYPAYSGRAPMRVNGGGDIRAPRGSRVEVHALVEHAPAGGRLVINGIEQQTLDGAGERLQGTLDIDADGHYRIELATADGRMLAVSPEHTIEALQDLPPVVRLERPGRDARVSSIEEVEIAIAAEDDLAVRALELVLSVNGGDEEVLSLAQAEARALLEANHTLYLEQRGMQPGDLIAYYARARDADDAAERDVMTDIYFMEVRPFEREYRQADSGGGGGGGGGGGQGEERLAAQQRTLVVALYNTVRDRNRQEPADHAERLASIGQAQARIRARVEAIARRLQSRSIVQLDPGFQQMARELPLAAAAMLEVESKLDAGEGSAAQAPARNALLHLQRAEAAFRSVQVTRSRADGRGGSSGDLENLFRLEMDRFQNQYADVRRGRWQEQEQNARLDETLRRLRELARRQQQEIERARLRAERGDAAGAQSQRGLAEEVERMARELERLSRERPQPGMRELARQLRDAAAAMRDAARANDPAASRAALDRLQEARRMLDADRPQRLAAEVDEALRLARALEQRQEAVRDALRGRDAASAAAGDGGARESGSGDASQSPDTGTGGSGDTSQAPGTGTAAPGDDASARERADTAELERQKAAMLDELGELRRRLQQGRASAAAQPQVRARLGDAADTLREGSVADKVARSRQALSAGATPSPELERQIARTLRDSRQHIEAAAAAAGQGSDARTARARERLAAVVRGLNRLQQQQQRTPGGRARSATGATGAPADGAVSGVGERGPGAGAANANLRDALRAYGQELTGLRDELDLNPKAVGDLQHVIDGLFSEAEAAGDPGAKAPELLATLQRLERDLRLAREARVPAPLIAAPRGEAPIDYRRLVADYFRDLSDNPGR